MPTAACTPCRERKLKCDRKPPSCSNCTRARLTCPGYSKSLSWPRLNDKKRSFIGPEPPRGRARTVHNAHIRRLRWTNVHFQDIRAYHYVTTGASLREPWTNGLTSPLSFKMGLSWAPASLDPTGLTLLQYFQKEASLAITCGSDTDYLPSVVTRLALHDDSASSQAVLHSVLAVASLRRHGPNTETIERQGAALRALERSAKSGINGHNIAQHVAAGVLLCCFDIFGTEKSSGPWFLHVESTKLLVKGTTLNQHVTSSEFLAMTDWLYHHDVHAQFGLRHWRGKHPNRRKQKGNPPKTSTMRENTKSMTALVRELTELTGLEGATHMVLWPMADIFENVVDSSHPLYHDSSYRQELEELERGLESILNGRHVAEADRKTPATPFSDADFDFFVLEIYRLAALIYLERSSKSFSGSSPKIDTWVNAAFALMPAFEHLKHSFPIFIIGCEARTDEHKIVVLDCIAKSQGYKPTATMKIVHDMVQSAWALQDLETEREVDYMTKLDTVINGCEIMPSFA